MIGVVRWRHCYRGSEISSFWYFTLYTVVFSETLKHPVWQQVCCYVLVKLAYFGHICRFWSLKIFQNNIYKCELCIICSLLNHIITSIAYRPVCKVWVRRGSFRTHQTRQTSQYTCKELWMQFLSYQSQWGSLGYWSISCKIMRSKDLLDNQIHVL